MPASKDTSSKKVSRNARLATLDEALPGLGLVEKGAVVAEGGRIVFAGPEAALPTGLKGAGMLDC